MPKLPLVVLAAVLATLLSVNAHATWSAIAVDRSTGEIGIVGARCGSGRPAVDLLDAQFERLSRPATNQPD